MFQTSSSWQLLFFNSKTQFRRQWLKRVNLNLKHALLSPNFWVTLSLGLNPARPWRLTSSEISMTPHIRLISGRRTDSHAVVISFTLWDTCRHSGLMPHDTIAKVSKDIWRLGSLAEYVSSIELTLNLVMLEMTSLTSLMYKMHLKVNMLWAVTATDWTLRPSDARFMVGKYRNLCSLPVRKTKPYQGWLRTCGERSPPGP